MPRFRAECRIYGCALSLRMHPKMRWGVSVYRGSTKTSRVWQSGEVKPGGLSAVGSILFPHTRSGVPVTGISLVMTIYGANFGNGGPLALGNIGHC